MKYVKIITCTLIVFLLAIIIRNNIINKDLPVHFLKSKGYFSIQNFNDGYLLRFPIIGSKNGENIMEILQIEFNNENVLVNGFSVFKDDFGFINSLITDMAVYYLDVRLQINKDFSDDEIVLNTINITTSEGNSFSYDIGSINIMPSEQKNVNSSLSSIPSLNLDFYLETYTNNTNSDILIENINIGEFNQFKPILKIGDNTNKDYISSSDFDFEIDLKEQSNQLNYIVKPNQKIAIQIDFKDFINKGYYWFYFEPVIQIRQNNISSKHYLQFVQSGHNLSFREANYFYKQLLKNK